RSQKTKDRRQGSCSKAWVLLAFDFLIRAWFDVQTDGSDFALRSAAVGLLAFAAISDFRFQISDFKSRASGVAKSAVFCAVVCCKRSDFPGTKSWRRGL